MYLVRIQRLLAGLTVAPADPSRPASMPPRLLLAIAVAMLACSIPFWTGPWIGMVDYPHHLARYFILTNTRLTQILRSIIESIGTCYPI
jgi:hypothetical protein